VPSGSGPAVPGGDGALERKKERVTLSHPAFMLKQQLDELGQVQRQLARVRALGQEVVRARKADFDAIKTLGTLVASENVQQGLLVAPPPVLEPVAM